MLKKVITSILLLVALWCASVHSACVPGGSPTYTTDPAYAASSVVTKLPSSGECGGIGPIGIAMDNNNQLYICNYPNGPIYKFDMTAPLPRVGAGSGTIFSTTSCTGLVFDGRYLWAGTDGEFRLSRFDLSIANPPKQVMASSPAPILGLAIDPSTGDVYMSLRNAQLARFQKTSSTFQVLHSFVNGFADGITIDAIGKYLYVAAPQTSRVYRIDLQVGGYPETIVATVTGGPDGIALASNPVNPAAPPYLFVVNNDGRVVKIDMSVNPATTSNIVTGGTRGDFATTGPDGCFYATQSNSILRVTNADGTCSLSPTSPHPIIGISNPQLQCGTSINVPFASNQAVTFHSTSADPLNTISVSQDVANSAGDVSAISFAPSLPTPSLTSPVDVVATYSASANAVSAKVTLKVTDLFQATASCALTFCTIPIISGDGCLSGNVELTVEPADLSGVVQFQLIKDGFDFGAPQNEDTFIVNVPGQYSVRYLDTRTGCAVQSSNSINVTPSPSSVVTVTEGSVNSCAGSPVTLTAQANGDYSYQWYQDNIPILGATSRSITVSQPSDSGSYYVHIVYNPTGCATDSDSIAVNIVSSPPSSFSVSSSSFCEGDGVTFTGPSGAFTYNWKKNGVTVGTSQTLGPLSSVSDNGQYILTVTTTGVVQCSSISQPYQLTINPRPIVTASISPVVLYKGYNPMSCAQAICSATIPSPNQNDAISYEWLSPINAFSASVQVCTNTLQIGVNTLTCRATDTVTGCSATQTTSVTVVDARCGTKKEKVMVCHLRSTPNPHTLCIPEQAVPAHLDHGDTVGDC